MIKRANQKKKKGFSLIELIIVLAVMAIIALIAIPNFNAVRENSKTKADARSCETIERTMMMLFADETLMGSGVITYNGTATSTSVATTIKTKDDVVANNNLAVEKVKEALKDVNAPQGKTKDTVNTSTGTFTSGDEGKAAKFAVVVSATGDITVKTSK